MQSFDGQPERDPRKAKRFFEYARTVSDARNYDYGIVCWINGLKHDPTELSAHKELLQVGYQRKRSEGRGVQNRDLKNAPGGSTPIDDMLKAEFCWAHDPQNAALAKSVIEYACAAELYEVASWVAEIIRSNRHGE